MEGGQKLKKGLWRSRGISIEKTRYTSLARGPAASHVKMQVFGSSVFGPISGRAFKQRAGCAFSPFRGSCRPLLRLRRKTHPNLVINPRPPLLNGAVPIGQWFTQLCGGSNFLDTLCLELVVRIRWSGAIWLKAAAFAKPPPQEK